MSKQNKIDRQSSVTTTTEGTPEGTPDSLEALTPREEKVLRMRHGMSEDDSRTLQYALGADEETQMKLAMIESHLVECIASRSEDDESERPSPAELISSWLDRD